MTAEETNMRFSFRDSSDIIAARQFIDKHGKLLFRDSNGSYTIKVTDVISYAALAKEKGLLPRNPKAYYGRHEILKDMGKIIIEKKSISRRQAKALSESQIVLQKNEKGVEQYMAVFTLGSKEKYIPIDTINKCYMLISERGLAPRIEGEDTEKNCSEKYSMWQTMWD